MSTEISVASHFVGTQPALSLKNATEFPGIHTRKSYILLHFNVIYRIDSQQITKTERLSCRRCKYSVSFGLDNATTEKLPMRLKDAYALITVKNTESE